MSLIHGNQPSKPASLWGVITLRFRPCEELKVETRWSCQCRVTPRVPDWNRWFDSPKPSCLQQSSSVPALRWPGQLIGVVIHLQDTRLQICRIRPEENEMEFQSLWQLQQLASLWRPIKMTCLGQLARGQAGKQQGMYCQRIPATPRRTRTPPTESYVNQQFETWTIDIVITTTKCQYAKEES